MIKQADKVLASTTIMGERVRQCGGINEVDIIEDSIDYPRKEPVYRPDDGKLRVFWYGHHSNLDTLAPILPLPDHCELSICTSNGIQLPMEFNGMDINIAPWSPQAMLVGLEWCDCVILPIRDELRKMGKSHNRMTEAIQRGKFVIAGELNSYTPYKDSMWIGDIHEGLEWLIDQPAKDIETRIAYAQKTADQYLPENIGEKWATYIEETAGVKT